MARVIRKENLERLIFDFAKNQKVFAPVYKNGQSVFGKYIFEQISSKSNLAFWYPTTTLPPKEILLPPKDTLFDFKDDKIKPPVLEKTFIFGVTSYDLEGVFCLDKIFEKPVSDLVYKRRRENIVIVAIDHFSPPKDVFYDLYLMILSEGLFAAFAKTKEGQKIISLPYFFDKKITIPTVKKKKDELIFDKDLSEAIERSKDHKVWDDLAEICFGCGICSYVCPLCYCFEVEDEIEFSRKQQAQGQRCRMWDSCMLAHFAETTNHNFRPELRNRIYNWYFHKFVRMPKEFGFPGCIDCNRCTIYCPAKINYREVINKVLKDYKKGKTKK